ncbi:GAF domain-containing protein [Bordetella sp. BOR01]|uniref:GAF domain-containing protein n=1 Tax=Bordetella sp. BOR01 TaxID=2854779 RepID=UPI001C448317|nr:GAF domain-containing protein [Bordetella sp. BOR01]MBV7486727.1 GAF domain-containing protein [Bordetella sp. BOR01]
MTQRQFADALAAHIDPLAQGCASHDPQALFGAIDAFAQQTLGQRLCTINRYDPGPMTVVRQYSSNADAYPPGGMKHKAGTAWGRQVLLEQRLFIGQGTEAIRQAFDDHAAIAALGLQSVINVPVVARGVCLGTVNFLMTAKTVTPEHVAVARLAGLLAVPGLLTAT